MPFVRSSGLQSEQKIQVQTSMHTLNIDDLKEAQKPKRHKAESWRDKLIYWVLISLVGSLVFGALGFINIEFAYIAPMFPFLAIVSWLVRNVMKKAGIDKTYNHQI